MTRITAHDVDALDWLNAEVQRWNESRPHLLVTTDLRGPTGGWWVRIVSAAFPTAMAEIAEGQADTLGDAINAALAAWKEARG